MYKSTAIKYIFGCFKEAGVWTEQPSACISSLKLISCHRSETLVTHSPILRWFLWACCGPCEWANRESLHGSLPWALRAAEGVETEIKGTWIIPHWQCPLSSWFGIGGEGENCGVGVDGDQGKQPLFSNLYPPLTPAPQCVAEIRAIGQSPILCHPEYFKVKPPRLTKSLTHQRFTFPLFLRCTLSPLELLPFFMHPSLYGPLFCLHT